MTGVIMQVRSLVSVAQFETGLTGTPYAASAVSTCVCEAPLLRSRAVAGWTSIACTPLCAAQSTEPGGIAS